MYLQIHFSNGNYECNSYTLRIKCNSVVFIEYAYLTTEKLLASFTNNPPNGKGYPSLSVGIQTPEVFIYTSPSAKSGVLLTVIIIGVVLLVGIGFFVSR